MPKPKPPSPAELRARASGRRTQDGRHEVKVLPRLPSKADSNLGAGSVAFCMSLYRSRLLPALLPLVGAVGYGFLALGAVLELFGLPWGIFFSGPGGLFELFLGGWLITRGFRTVTPSVAA
ncbi:DUF4386 domain-containing protein [Corallococcus exiguus]|uniref:DUF4386 domain-containing protein n=1 Tax=Corallococcus exiguus TaxID=83462 RepID=UPI0021C22F9B|nr:DUF4386 domain-containing protein [Corallococcus exiguus]